MAIKNKKEEYKTSRIDDLEDQRFEKLCEQVDDIHRSVYGNGQPGLKSKVAALSTKVYILMTAFFILLTVMVGKTYKDKITESPKIEIHQSN